MEMTVGIAVLGCGTVGSSVAERLLREQPVLERRSGVRYRVCGIAILDRHKPRAAAVERRLLTLDAASLVDDPGVDLVIEVIGGVAKAAELVERALYRGRHVVTANKELLATHGPRLQALAAAGGAALRCEGAVAGAVPILRTLNEALAGDQILSVAGVVNGTCVSILSAMEEGVDFDEALARAQSLGYAEADPSNDIDGADSAHKLALLAQSSFGLAVISPRIRHSGIRHVTQRDVARARMAGMRIRPVVAAARSSRGIFAEAAAVAVPETTSSRARAAHRASCRSTRAMPADSRYGAKVRGAMRRHRPCSATSLRCCKRSHSGATRRCARPERRSNRPSKSNRSSRGFRGAPNFRSTRYGTTRSPAPRSPVR